MPSNPTPDIYTDRYYLDYEGDHGKHTMLLRVAPGTASATAMAKVSAFVTVAKNFFYSTTRFHQVRFSAAGSVVSFPQTWTSVSGLNTGTHTGDMMPRFVSFVGRDSSNRKTRIFFIGANIAPDADYRVMQADNTAVANMLTELRSTTTPLLAITGLVPFWNSYANTGYHAYHQRKRRKVA